MVEMYLEIPAPMCPATRENFGVVLDLGFSLILGVFYAFLDLYSRGTFVLGLNQEHPPRYTLAGTHLALMTALIVH